jgi:hypothetical protein
MLVFGCYKKVNRRRMVVRLLAWSVYVYGDSLTGFNTLLTLPHDYSLMQLCLVFNSKIDFFWKRFYLKPKFLVFMYNSKSILHLLLVDSYKSPFIHSFITLNNLLLVDSLMATELMRVLEKVHCLFCVPASIVQLSST